MTDLRTIRATGPADLLALVPSLLGFHPEESVVVLTLGTPGTGSMPGRTCPGTGSASRS